MRTRLRSLALATALLAAVVVTATAVADQASDFNTVYADFQGDSDITPCRYPRDQLVNARSYADQNQGDWQYNGFREEVDREINRYDAGGCPASSGGGSAGANADFNAVYSDWRTDHDVTACRFTRAQLVNARDVAASSPDFSVYNPGFVDEVNREIARWDAGGCAGSSTTRGRLRIVRVRGKGGPKKEYVRIKNVGRRKVSLRGYALKNRRGRRIRLSRRVTIRPKRLFRVVPGCYKARKRPVRRRSRYYACRKRAFLRDKGDVVRLVKGRKVVSRFGFGRFRRVRRF